jgi:GNAT superfamily N-acetyltransferase
MMAGTSGDRYTVSTDPARLDIDLVHRFLSTQAYWAIDVPRTIVETAIGNSLNFGAYLGDAQIGYARVVTDRSTFAWLCDVFVLPEHRGRGVSRLLMDAVMAHPELAGLRNFVLATRDAHGLYAKFGFTPLAEPERWMAIRKNPYAEDARR